MKKQIPANIGRDVNPGGLVVITYDEDAKILRQSNIGAEDSEQKAVDDAMFARDYTGGNLLVVCFYDGDSGDPFAPAIVYEREWKRT